ncbi:hypothetical protein AMTR_s00009p00267490 [Amborella trichopoda]|uniref:Protein kinase domain-containing protein n=2 Tax=Amborella trichopoda TaxID=13333 RepID=W1NJ34_AMBTC|nr:hypothetical protein AMTR_s00009p00267490 [Amborella trichopoda]
MTFCCLGGFLAGTRDTTQTVDGLLSPKNIKLFSYIELRSATKNFHPSNRIGRGGFGTVYRGTLRDGTEVAVKSLSAESKQGVHEFLTEIDMIADVRHPNLVTLIGCCVQGNHRILVYEYVENNSLAYALLGPENKRIELDWNRRSAICMGTANGLAFLHEELEPHIVHRDIKASNILLDKDLLPKIGDFGLAKLFPNNITHISTRVAGTVGYLAPEYAMRGQLTKKADVYSFGILILEIISGRSSAKATWSAMQKFLLEWTWQLYEEGRLLELVDPELEEYPEEEVLRFIKVALFCTQAACKQRPDMKQVVTMLSSHTRLNEKILMAPGLVKDLMGIKGDFRPANSSNSETPIPSTSSAKSATNLLSSPMSFTEIMPR